MEMERTVEAFSHLPARPSGTSSCKADRLPLSASKLKHGKRIPRRTSFLPSKHSLAISARSASTCHLKPDSDICRPVKTIVTNTPPPILPSETRKQASQTRTFRISDKAKKTKRPEHLVCPRREPVLHENATSRLSRRRNQMVW